MNEQVILPLKTTPW